jgi:hypothetical protein
MHIGMAPCVGIATLTHLSYVISIFRDRWEWRLAVCDRWGKIQTYSLAVVGIGTLTQLRDGVPSREVVGNGVLL